VNEAFFGRPELKNIHRSADRDSFPLIRLFGWYSIWRNLSDCEDANKALSDNFQCTYAHFVFRT
jgi:hypothetical protein